MLIDLLEPESPVYIPNRSWLSYLFQSPIKPYDGNLEKDKITLFLV